MRNDVEIVRGTTNTFEITVTNANGEPYILGTNEKLLFGVKKNHTDSEYIFVKTVLQCDKDRDGVYIVTVHPEDTEKCECNKYFYDVAVQSGDNFFNVIEASFFRVNKNITCRGCG